MKTICKDFLYALHHKMDTYNTVEQDSIFGMVVLWPRVKNTNKYGAVGCIYYAPLSSFILMYELLVTRKTVVRSHGQAVF